MKVSWAKQVNVNKRRKAEAATAQLAPNSAGA